MVAYVSWRIIAWPSSQRLVELPAGTLEPPEEPVKTALRELAEETGYRAAHIEHLTTLCMSPGILDEKMYVYRRLGADCRRDGPGAGRGHPRVATDLA